MSTLPQLSEGDRVRLKDDHKATGEIDEIWRGGDGRLRAAVVWDVSGCVGEGMLEDLEEDQGATE